VLSRVGKEKRKSDFVRRREKKRRIQVRFQVTKTVVEIIAVAEETREDDEEGRRNEQDLDLQLREEAGAVLCFFVGGGGTD